MGWDAGRGTWSGVETAAVHPVNLLLPQPTLTQVTAQLYLHSLQSMTEGKGQVPGHGRLGVMETVGCSTGLQEKRKAVVRVDSPSSSAPQAPRRPGAESR